MSPQMNGCVLIQYPGDQLHYPQITHALSCQDPLALPLLLLLCLFT